MMKKTITPIVVVLTLIGLVIAFLQLENIRTASSRIVNIIERKDKIVVNSFDSCVLADYPIQESYPRRCILPDGTVFTEDVREIEYDIILKTPRPNSTLESPVIITGEATGSWFFEASFTVDMVDSEGKIIATAILVTKSEWMTEDLVPFEGELEFDNALDGNGELILKSANPSGFDKNQKIFSIPVKF